MSSGSSDLESISEFKFEATSEPHEESIPGCYNNESEYSHKEIDKMKEKKSVSEKEGSKKDDIRRVTQHGVPVRAASLMRI